MGRLSTTCFNSRSREGSDYQKATGALQRVRFNSRSREGSDRILPNRSILSSSCFNSRSREGSDVGDRIISYRLVVSIHAPVKGATHCS